MEMSGSFSATVGKLNSTNIYWSVAAAGYFVLQSFISGNVSLWNFMNRRPWYYLCVYCSIPKALHKIESVGQTN